MYSVSTNERFVENLTFAPPNISDERTLETHHRAVDCAHDFAIFVDDDNGRFDRNVHELERFGWAVSHDGARALRGQGVLVRLMN